MKIKRLKNLKLIAGKIDMELILCTIEAIVLTFIFFFGITKCVECVKNRDYSIVVDEKGFRLDGQCELNVLYYVYDYNLTLAKDTNDNVIWCENLTVSRDARKEIEWQ